MGDVPFENLMFLWYDEENGRFVELETILEEENEVMVGRLTIVSSSYFPLGHSYLLYESFVDDELYLGDLAGGYEICYEDGELVHYREDAEWKNIDNWECITIGGTSVDGNERFGGI